MTGIVTRSSARAAPPASTADAKLAGPLKKRAVVGATDPPEKSRHQDSCAHTEDKSDEGMMREAGEVDDVPDCPTPPTGARATRSPYSPDPEHAQPQQLGAWWAPLVRAEGDATRPGKKPALSRKEARMRKGRAPEKIASRGENFHYDPPDGAPRRGPRRSRRSPRPRSEAVASTRLAERPKGAMDQPRQALAAAQVR